MRLDEWQRYIEAQFLDENALSPPKSSSTSGGVKQDSDTQSLIPSSLNQNCKVEPIFVADDPERLNTGSRSKIEIGIETDTPLAANSIIELKTTLSTNVDDTNRADLHFDSVEPDETATLRRAKRRRRTISGANFFSEIHPVYTPGSEIITNEVISSDQAYTSKTAHTLDTTPPSDLIQSTSHSRMSGSGVDTEDEFPDFSDYLPMNHPVLDLSQAEPLQEQELHQAIVTVQERTNKESTLGNLDVLTLRSIPECLLSLLTSEKQDRPTDVAQNSYKRPFQETRQELIERLLDPILTLEETARLLNVCPTTVRRYSNNGLLHSYRKPLSGLEARLEEGESLVQHKETRQRRFRLSEVVAFIQANKSEKIYLNDIKSQNCFE